MQREHASAESAADVAGASVTSIHVARASRRNAQPRGDELTELDIAARFVERFGDRVRYCAERGGWLAYDGKRWARDTLERVREYAKQAIGEFRAEAAALNDDGLWKLVRRASTARGIDGVLACVRSDPRVAIAGSALDADGWALNCESGTIDLRTGALRPHSPDDLITMLAPVEYDAGARSDLWERYLSDALGDEATIAFVRRAVGYSITGDIREDKCFLVLGPPRCGKGTFAGAIGVALGDYAGTADFKTFLNDEHEAGDRARPDLVRLIGRRFVTTSEVSPRARMDEARLKSLTGGDSMTVRALYREHVDARPTFKLWFAANNPPRLSDDDAVWTRVVKLSFDRLASVPVEDRDPQLRERLRDARASGPAVLAWAVRGCLEWQARGLDVPPSVKQATTALRMELDSARRFLESHVTIAPGRAVTARALYTAYERYCEEEGDTPVSKKALAAALSAHGDRCGVSIAAKRTNRDRLWQGVRLDVPEPSERDA